MHIYHYVFVRCFSPCLALLSHILYTAVADAIFIPISKEAEQKMLSCTKGRANSGCECFASSDLVACKILTKSVRTLLETSNRIPGKCKFT